MAELMSDPQVKDLLFDMRTDLEEYPHVRDFFVLPKSDAKNTIDLPHEFFIFYEDKHPDLLRKVDRLVSQGYVVAVKDGPSRHRYRITEKLADDLLDWR